MASRIYQMNFGSGFFSGKFVKNGSGILFYGSGIFFPKCCGNPDVQKSFPLPLLLYSGMPNKGNICYCGTLCCAIDREDSNIPETD